MRRYSGCCDQVLSLNRQSDGSGSTSELPTTMRSSSSASAVASAPQLRRVRDRPRGRLRQGAEADAADVLAGDERLGGVLRGGCWACH